MTGSVVTPERFAKGMTFEEYARYVGSPENLAREAWGGYFPDSGSKPTIRKDNSTVFRERYARARLSEHQTAAIKWLVTQPDAPAHILAISEDWSSDCRRDIPMLARLAEAGGLEFRIFNRDGKKILGTRRPDPAAYPDGNHDLMLELLNRKDGGEWASLPVAVVYTRTSASSTATSSTRRSTTRTACAAISRRRGPARPKSSGRSATGASSSPCSARPSSTSGPRRRSTRS